jgi:glycosyltransferase involved in cell wall biosynthesis
MTPKYNTLIILIPGFPADEQDSTCLPFPQAFVRNLKILNPALSIKVLAFQYPFFESLYEWHGVEVQAFNGGNRGGFSHLLLWKKIRRSVKEIFQKEQVMGILNFWMGETALIAKYAAQKYKVRSFTWLMGQDARENNRYVSIVRPKPESLIALSDFLSDEYYKNYEVRPVNTILPGIDIRSFSTRAHDREIDILGVGSLIPLKQFDQIITLITEIVPAYPGIKVVICGEGPERDTLEKLILDYHLGDHIELRGELDHGTILLLMQNSKILVHPSSYEGFSTVCAEALYAGAHVISYCKPMHRDYGHHHIVDTKDEMKEKIAELLDDEQLNHESVLTYPIEESCKKILSLYS